MPQNKLVTLPINQDFINFINEKKQINYKNSALQSKYSLGANPPIIKLPYYKETLSKKSMYPPYYDLRTSGKVSSVKDQGSIGSCWSFTTYGSLESNLLPDEQMDFSENNMINNNGFDYGPNGGGNPFMSAAYLARWSGPMSEADDPYTGVIHPSPENISPTKHVQEILFLHERLNASDNDEIKDVLMNHGALYSNIYWNDNYYNAGKSAYYYNVTGTSINHAVTIVGWDDNYSSSNFKNTPAGNGAFIAKNSWGASWGENGYFYISYYDSCFEALAVFSNAEKTNNFKEIYQYDPLGFVTGIGFDNKPILWTANKFTAVSNNPISAVSFYTIFPSTECTISLYKNCTNSPNSGDLADTKLFNAGMAGYYTVNFDNPIPITEGTKFSIVIKLSVPAGYTSFTAIEYKQDGYSSGVTINPDESFISSDAAYWYDLYNEVNVGNACIKAFTVPNVSKPIITFEPIAKTVEKYSTAMLSDEFTVAVKIENLSVSQTVSSFRNIVSFNPSILQIVKCEIPVDCFLKPFTSDPIISINNAVGTIDFYFSRQENPHNLTEGVIFNITLKAASKGNTTLVYSKADLRDTLNNQIDIITKSCSITINEINSLIGDFNFDNKIDFEDLILFAKAWNHKTGDIGWENVVPSLTGTPYKEKDIGSAVGVSPNLTITPDNIVDIKDYSVFVQMWKYANN